MSTAAFAFALMPVVLAAATSAASQVTQGGQLQTHNKRAATIEGDDDLAARNAARKYGICVAARSRDRVDQTLGLPADTPDLQKRLVKLATSECLNEGGLRFSVRVLRGALYEGLYVVKYGSAKSADVAQAPAIDWTAPYTMPLSQGARIAVALATLGECAARLRPDAARSLILAQPGSANERISIDGLKGLLPRCVPQGLTMRLSTDILRGAIAEGLFRLRERAPAYAELRQ